MIGQFPSLCVIKTQVDADLNTGETSAGGKVGETAVQKHLRDKGVGSIWYSKMGISNVVKGNILQAATLILLPGWVCL